jgi:hypothetical protein
MTSRDSISISVAVLRRLERGSSQVFDRLANSVGSRNSSTQLGAHTTILVVYAHEVVTALPRGYWRLNERSGTAAMDLNVVTDGVKSNVAGALVNDSDPAVSFTGGRVNIPGTLFDYARTASFGAEFWVKATGATNGALISNVNDGTATKRGWEVSYNAGTSTLLFHLAADESGGDRLAVSTTHNLHDGNYHHVWVQYGGTSTPAGVSIYIDNVLKTNTTVANGLTGTTTTGNQLTIAGRTGGPYTTVTLDEVAVYSHNVTAQYVDWHYKAGLGQEVQR